MEGDDTVADVEEPLMKRKHGMGPLLTPKLDVVFKLLFTRDTAILLDLVNTVLVYPEQVHIHEIEIKNPIVLPEELTEKFIILDILAVDEARRQYDIEMQVQQYSIYPERALYYLCRLYGNQLNSGESYGQLTPVIGIHFLDYEHFTEYPDIHFCFELCEVRHPNLRLSKDLTLHVFELPKLEHKGRQMSWGDPLFEWLHFLSHAHEEGDEKMRTKYSNPAIHKAFEVLEALSADERTRQQAEIREKALKNEVSMLEAAREEGLKEGRQEGVLQNAHEAVIEILQVRFERVPEGLVEVISAIDDLGFLKRLHRSAVTIDSLDEFAAMVEHQNDM